MYASAQTGIRSTSGRLSNAVSNAPFVSMTPSSVRASAGTRLRRPCSIDAIVSGCTTAASAS